MPADDLPPKYVPLLLLVPPAEIGKVGPGLFRGRVVDSQGSYAA